MLKSNFVLYDAHNIKHIFGVPVENLEFKIKNNQTCKFKDSKQIEEYLSTFEELSNLQKLNSTSDENFILLEHGFTYVIHSHTMYGDIC